MRKTLILLACVPLVLLIGTATGSFHPLGDSLAVFRFHIGFVTLLSASIWFYTQPNRIAGAACVLALAAIFSIWTAGRPYSKDLSQLSKAGLYSVYQKNLSYRLPEVGPIVQDIQNKKPDYITLQEVTLRNLAILKRLKDDFPTQHYCKSRVGGVAVASRFPAVENSALCSESNGLAAVKVQSPTGPLWVVSIHLHWPFPYSQAKHVERLLPVLERLDAGVILGGDFNMVPWSYTMTQIEAATRSKRVGAVNGTFNLKNSIMIPIDHVLAPVPCHHWNSTLDLLGSDHHGVLAEFTSSC